MRFISRHPRYSYHAQAQQFTIVNSPNGPVQVPSMPMVLCQFEQGGLSPWEIEYAVKNFHFAGQPDENAVPKETRLSFYDTEIEQLKNGWDDEFRMFVEQRLLSDGAYGSDYIALNAPRRRAPWPSYEKIDDIDTLTQFINVLGFRTYEGIEEIRLFEHESQKRPLFLQALEQLQAELEPATEPVPDETEAEVVRA